jgi:hypothetical protein
MKHTPGPWKVVRDVAERPQWFRVEAEDGNICVPCYGRDMGLDEGDAHLIAAAPELLACLRRMCGMYGAYSRRLAPLMAEDEGTVWTFERANSLALEAIAKAEGR